MRKASLGFIFKLHYKSWKGVISARIAAARYKKQKICRAAKLKRIARDAKALQDWVEPGYNRAVAVYRATTETCAPLLPAAASKRAVLFSLSRAQRDLRPRSCSCSCDFGLPRSHPQLVLSENLFFLLFFSLSLSLIAKGDR